MAKRIKGLMTLSEGILCKKEVLGQIYGAEIAGEKVSICFPRYPIVEEGVAAVGFQYPLRPPEIGDSWRRGDKSLEWGRPLSYPYGDAVVESLALYADCEEKEAENTAQNLYNNITKWEHAFVDYIILETKQNSFRSNSFRRKTCDLNIWAEKHIPDRRIHPITACIIRGESFYASNEQIYGAIQFASSGKEFLLEYQMLLSAYEARSKNRNRSAVLDATAAIEIVLNNQIKNYCQSKGIDTDILLKKYRYLGEKFELVKIIDASFPKEDYQSTIVYPRNAVMHNKDVYPSDETTNKLIRCVEKYLEHFHVSYY